MNLDDITLELGKNYKSWKQFEKNKEKLRIEFFEAAEEENKKKTLARKTIGVAVASTEDARTYAEQYFSKWVVKNVEQIKEDYFSVTLEENPKFLPFVHVNRHIGMTFTKEISEKPAMVDDDALKEADPDLWEAISYVPERQLKPLDELTSDQLTKLQDYIYRPAPTVKLGQPKRIQEED